MGTTKKTRAVKQTELAELRSQLAEAQETLRAIRSGEVDALVVSTSQGDQIFTLRSADYSYRVLVETMSEGAVVLAVDGTILYSNQRFASLVLTPLQKVIGTDFIHYVQQPDHEKFNQHLQLGLLGTVKGEFTLQIGEQARLPVSLSISLLKLETPIACVIVTDLTESKRAFQALEDERQRLLDLSRIERQQRLFAEGLAQASYALNSSLDLEEVFDHILDQIQRVIPFAIANISVIEAECFRIARIRNLKSAILAPKISEGTYRIADFQLVRTIFESRQAVVVPDTHAEPNWVSLPGWEWVRSYIGVPLLFGDQVVGILHLDDDQPTMVDPEQIAHLAAFANQAALAIQNARMYENLEHSLRQEQLMRAQMIQAEKFAAVGRMVASISHELNNPLQSIRNCLYLTRQDLDENDEHSYLSLAIQEVQRLSVLVSQLREVYRPRPAGQTRWVNLIDLLAQVKTLVAYELESANVLWQQNQQSGEFGVISSEDQLKQVFLNISLNAVQAMQISGGTLFIDFISDPAVCLHGVALRDTGPGIEPENIQKLFEPLFTTKPKGMGLGLSISMNILQAHGGKIDVESQVGVGSTFTVWLPQATRPTDLPLE